MTKYEYLVVALPEGIFDKATRYTVELKRYAEMGWRLVSVSGSLAYFERAIGHSINPEFIDVAQLEAMVTKIVAQQFGLDRK